MPENCNDQKNYALARTVSLAVGASIIAGRVNHQFEGVWNWLGIALADIVSIGITVVFIAIQWRWSHRRSYRCLQEIIYTVLHSMTLAASSTSIVALFARVITWTY